MCRCLNESIKSGNQAKKKECLVLQEKLVKAMGEGTPAHDKFRKEMSECERKIAIESVSPAVEPGTLDEKVDAVCRCAQKNKNNRRDYMKCFILQDHYSKSFSASGEDQINFNKKSNLCF